MNKSLIESLESKFQAEESDALLRMLSRHNSERWSEEAFQAAKNTLAKRGVALPEGNIADSQGLRVLPAQSGYPCVCCNKAGRSLKFMSLRTGYGFLAWRRLTRRTGYICPQCAFSTTMSSLLALPLGVITIHPQALVWVPVVFFKNLSSWIAGAVPDALAGFRSADLKDGRITQDALASKAAVLVPRLNARPSDIGSVTQAALLIEAGFQGRDFSEQTYKAMLESHEKGLIRPWIKRIRARIADLGISPAEVESSSIQPTTLQLPQVQFALGLIPTFLVAGVLLPQSPLVRLIFAALSIASAPAVGYALWRIRGLETIPMAWSERRKQAGFVGLFGSLLRFPWFLFCFILDGAVTPSAIPGALADHLFPRTTVPYSMQLCLVILMSLFAIADLGVLIILWLPDDAFNRPETTWTSRT